MESALSTLLGIWRGTSQMLPSTILAMRTSCLVPYKVESTHYVMVGLTCMRSRVRLVDTSLRPLVG
jgi:hypothetical protein